VPETAMGPRAGGIEETGEESTVQTSSGCDPPAGLRDANRNLAPRQFGERVYSGKGRTRPKLRVLFRNLSSLAKVFPPIPDFFPSMKTNRPASSSPLGTLHAGRFPDRRQGRAAQRQQSWPDLTNPEARSAGGRRRAPAARASRRLPRRSVAGSPQ